MNVLVFRLDKYFTDDVIHVGALDLDDSIALHCFPAEPIGFMDNSNDVVILHPRRPSGSKHGRENWGLWAERIDAGRCFQKIGVSKKVWVLANE